MGLRPKPQTTTPESEVRNDVGKVINRGKVINSPLFGFKEKRKRKARGKENNPGALSTGLSAGAYAGVCERIRAREAIRRCGKIARPQDDPATRQKRIDRAKHLVMRKAPECLQTFWLILKNGSNREKSICEIMAKTRTRKK